MVEWLFCILVVGIILFTAAWIALDIQIRRQLSLERKVREIKIAVANPPLSKERKALVRAGLVHSDGKIVINERTRID